MYSAGILMLYNRAMMSPIRPATFLARFRPDGLTLLIAATAALGIGLVLAREATYGASLSWDSLLYVAVAQNLLAGEGFVDPSGGPHTLWPPFYPLLLAGAGLGMLPPHDVIGPLNAVMFGAAIFFVGQYLRHRIESRFLVVWACLTLALALPLSDLAASALAGSAFILLATLALIQADRFLDQGKVSSLILAAIFSALAWQTRHIGVAVPLFVGLLLLLQQGTSLPQRAKRVGLFSLIAALPTALWLLRNYLAVGDLPGNRIRTDYSLSGILADVVNGLWGWTHYYQPASVWMSFESLPLKITALTLLALAVAILIIAGWVYFREQQEKRLSFNRRPYYVFGGFALAYIPMLIAAIMLGNTGHGVEPRYLAPLYIPLLIAVVFALDGFLHYERESNSLSRADRLPVIRTFIREGVKPKLLSSILIITLSLWTAAQGIPNANIIIAANSGEYIGFGAPRWADSETLQYLRENPLPKQVYSNEPYLVNFHNNAAETYHGLPRTLLIGTSDPQVNDGPAAVPEQPNLWPPNAADGAYLVWFNDWRENVYAYGAAAMQATPALEPVAELADGIIFQVNRNYIPRSPHQIAYESIAAGRYGEPAARSTFDLYRNETALTYYKEQCNQDDTAARFFLHIVPSDQKNLPAHRAASGFNNLDFDFPENGVFLNGKCLAIIPLPNYAITRIRTGQYISGQGQIWHAEIPPER